MQVPDDADTTSTQRYEEARAAAHRAMSNVTIIPDQPPAPVQPEVDPDLLAYRGFKFGAAFFGWLISMAMFVVLSLAVAAAALGTAEILDYTRADAEAQPGAAGITAAAVAVLTLTLAFYFGGYVAGRLARFDGGRNGFGVWMFAFLFSVLAAGVAALLNNQYDLVDEVNRPDVPLATDTITTGGIVAAAALVVLTLLFSIVGGMAGRRYHDKIDRLLD
ncbi:hypothetical protein E1218_03395 [Kribbella turkmenica]|uniref:Uncharacterized protein n=2 Tax=Kribbella turkmenica TaxID=2530375 RepID=A0A4R4XH80_9ACTN|nr:hypothetical protein E1218_03395 [Kribbella turkmenica]